MPALLSAAGVVSGQQAATIESVAVTSRPGGGSGAEPVWIVGDDIVVEVRYSSDLPAGARATLKIELDERGDGNGATREATCAVDPTDAKTLACRYEVAEGDVGTGVSVEARAEVLRGTGLPTSLFAEGDVRGSPHDIDGVLLAIADNGVSVRLLDADGIDITADSDGAVAGDTVMVSLAFADGEEPDYSTGFETVLLLENARRSMTYVPDADGTLDFRYEVVPGDRARRFALALTGVDRLSDRNGNGGLAAGEDVNAKFLVGSRRRIDTDGPRITDIRIVSRPSTGAYVASVARDDNDSHPDTMIDLVVVFDEEVVLEAPVSLDVVVGAGPQSALCRAVEGKELSCTLTIEEGWNDTDGVSTPANPLAFGPDHLADDLGNVVVNQFGARAFPDHKVDTTRPMVMDVRVRVLPEHRAVAGNTIDVTITMSEDVVVSGMPVLSFMLGDAEEQFEYVRHSRRNLEFRYTLTKDDVEGVEGMEGEAIPIALDEFEAGNRGNPMIKDVHENGIADASDIQYTRPAISQLKVLDEKDRSDTRFLGEDGVYLIDGPANNRYGCWASVPASATAPCTNNVDFAVVFKEAVTFEMSQDIHLVVTIGGDEKRIAANSLPGEPGGSSRVKFRYPIERLDSGLILVKELRLGENTRIRDAADNGYENPENPETLARFRETIPLRLTGPLAQVDTEVPAVTDVRFLSAPAPQTAGPGGVKYYGEDETVEIQVSMSEDVVVEEGGSVSVNVDDSGPATAKFRELRSGRQLIYVYTVEANHIDRTGLSIDALATALTGAVVTDLAGNPATLQHRAVSSAAHRVDGTIEEEPAALDPPLETETPVAPTNAISSVINRSQDPASGYHGVGDDIVIEVNFDPPVTFTATPQLRFRFDEGGNACAAVDADIAAGRDVSRLTFRCKIAEGDEDRNGVEAGLVGTFTTTDGERVTTAGFGLPQPLRVDARPPVLESVRIASNGPYAAGADIDVELGFSEPVSARGTPTVPLAVGNEIRRATLRASSGARAERLVFRYTVAEGDADADGVTVPALGADSLGTGAALVDVAGNEAALDHAEVAGGEAHLVDTLAPEIASIAVAGPARTYGRGEAVTFEVAFSEPVVFVGRPTLTVTVGDVRRELALATPAGSEVSTLAFTYAVRLGDSGPIGVPANALAGTAADAVGNPVDFTSLPMAFAGYAVDASAPAVTSATLVSNAGDDGTYGIGDEIEVAVRFDEPVAVRASGTGPRLMLSVGERRRIALYSSGHTTSTLRFVYTVRAGDEDSDGVSVAANSLRLSDGAIVDASGLAAVLDHAAIPPDARHRVDGIAPEVTAAEISSAPAEGDAYLAGEEIVVAVTFSEAVTAAAGGAPTLAVTVGAEARMARCEVSGTSLACGYTVADGDFDGDGVSVATDALAGSLTDPVGNAASLQLPELPDDPHHRVYAAPPLAADPIPAMSLAAGGQTATVDLAAAFTGVLLSYGAESSDDAVAEVDVADATLTVRAGREGTATVTVTATNPAGEVAVEFDVNVTTDGAELASLDGALAAIGRGVLAGTAGVIGSRFDLAGRAPGAAMTLAGRSVTPAALSASLERRWNRAELPDDGWRGDDRRHDAYRPDGNRLLAGSGFAMPLRASSGGVAVAVWGGGDLHRFEGGPADRSYDGVGSMAHLGLDARGDGWLAGVSVSRSAAEADYAFAGDVMGEGVLQTTVTGVHPYAKTALGGGTEVWVIGGFGSGEAELERGHIDGAAETSDLGMAMVVGGLKRGLGLDYGGAAFSLKGDAGFLRLETDEGTRAVDGLSASVSRLRVAVEAAWKTGTARPFVEVAGRFDGGDGETGGGVELAGGLRMTNLGPGFGLEAKARVLGMHSGEGYAESGIAVTATFEPGRAGRGVTFRLAPRWGGSADSTDLFWDERASGGGFSGAEEVSRFRGRSTWGVDAVLGYGFDAGRVGGLVTPFGQVDVGGDDRRRLRLGMRYSLPDTAPGSARLEVSAERMGGGRFAAPETGVRITAEARF